jgi:hypothetical protein
MTSSAPECACGLHEQQNYSKKHCLTCIHLFTQNLTPLDNWVEWSSPHIALACLLLVNWLHAIHSIAKEVHVSPAQNQVLSFHKAAERPFFHCQSLCHLHSLQPHTVKVIFPKIHHSSWTILFLESSSHVSLKFNTFSHASPDLLMHLNSKLWCGQMKQKRLYSPDLSRSISCFLF